MELDEPLLHRLHRHLRPREFKGLVLAFFLANPPPGRGHSIVKMVGEALYAGLYFRHGPDFNNRIRLQPHQRPDGQTHQHKAYLMLSDQVGDACDFEGAVMLPLLLPAPMDGEVAIWRKGPYWMMDVQCMNLTFHTVELPVGRERLTDPYRGVPDHLPDEGGNSDPVRWMSFRSGGEFVGLDSAPMSCYELVSRLDCDCALWRVRGVRRRREAGAVRAVLAPPRGGVPGWQGVGGGAQAHVLAEARPPTGSQAASVSPSWAA